MSSDNLDLVGITNFSDEIHGAGTEASRQDRFFVFGGPYQVVFVIPDSVRRPAI